MTDGWMPDRKSLKTPGPEDSGDGQTWDGAGRRFFCSEENRPI